MITSLSQDMGRTSKRQTITPLDVAYHQLNEFIEKINHKIVDRIQLVQQVYLQDYKDQTQKMREQLKQLRANLDSQIIQQRSSQKLFVLEEQRDFFRAQVLKLNEQVNKFVEENKVLKKKVIDIEVQTANYKTIAFNYQKKIIKLQKELTQIANFKRQTSTPTLPLFQAIKASQDEQQKQSVREVQQSAKQIQQTVTSHVNFFQRRPNQIMRTKTYSKFESATKASIKKYQQYNERDQIINDCIKQIKKQIFYRSQQHKNNANNPLFDQFGKVQFDKFTRTDKKQLIQSLLGNEKILQQFNEFLLNRTSQISASRMLKTKIGDDKFNQKFLTDLKRSFNKKMYDLKANPDLLVKQGSERKRTRME